MGEDTRAGTLHEPDNRDALCTPARLHNCSWRSCIGLLVQWRELCPQERMDQYHQVARELSCQRKVLRYHSGFETRKALRYRSYDPPRLRSAYWWLQYRHGHEDSKLVALPSTL